MFCLLTNVQFTALSALLSVFLFVCFSRNRLFFCVDLNRSDNPGPR